MSTTSITLTGRDLTIAEVTRFARDGDVRVTIAPDAREVLGRSRAPVEQALAKGQTIYGVNTGFGKLANVSIAGDRLDQLQLNLIRSHAAGMGDPLPRDVVRAAMLLRANVLLRPTSGVRPALVDALVALINAGIVPVVPEQGSVGASGDLAPLAHIAQVLMGRARSWTATAHRSRGAGASSDTGSPRSGLLPRKGSRSSTEPRPRPRCSRCW